MCVNLNCRNVDQPRSNVQSLMSHEECAARYKNIGIFMAKCYTLNKSIMCVNPKLKATELNLAELTYSMVRTISSGPAGQSWSNLSGHESQIFQKVFQTLKNLWPIHDGLSISNNLFNTSFLIMLKKTVRMMKKFLSQTPAAKWCTVFKKTTVSSKNSQCLIFVKNF